MKPMESPRGAASDHPADILLVGDVMLDRYFQGRCDRISPEAPVPVLHVRNSFDRPGGAANVAVNVAAMGCRPRLVGAIGTDAAGERLRAVLEADGAPSDGLVAAAEIPTTTKNRLLAAHQQIARYDEERFLADPGVRRRILDRIGALMESAKLAIISDYAKGVCDATVCRAVIDGARQRGLPIVIDPKDADFTKYAGATVITPNRMEAAAVVGRPLRDPDEAIRAAHEIQQRWPIEAVVVTLGEQGLVMVSGTHETVIPTQAKQVYDVTGAGDTFVATLATALVEGLPLDRACGIANVAAGIQVSRIGTARITWSEVMEEIDRQSTASMGKVLTVPDLLKVVQRARSEGKRIGFTNGCFDILHHGHVALLEAAARECDFLVVGLNSDASVRRLKGPPRPFMPAAARQAVLAGLTSVACVCEFDDDTPLELIRAVSPDVLIKGGDYSADKVVGADIVTGRGGKVVTPLFVPGVSTTNIADRILATSRPS